MFVLIVLLFLIFFFLFSRLRKRNRFEFINFADCDTIHLIMFYYDACANYKNIYEKKIISFSFLLLQHCVKSEDK